MRPERVLSTPVAKLVVMTLPRRVTDRLGPTWAARLERPGYLLLPLRAFLGLTFCYAGLQKLANPAYLHSSSPTSVYAQMHALRSQSPIGPLVSLSSHAPTLVGLLIALGELAVGVGTLLGLLTRVAAVGGAVLALSFFLTVSWNTTPYYYGSDIVFLFAWTVLVAFGSGGVLSMDVWLHNRARRRVGLRPVPVSVPIAATRLQELCGRQGKCGMDATSGSCSRPKTCPVFAPTERLTPGRARDLNRRTLLATGAGVAGVGLATAFLAGTTAAVGRAQGSSAGTPHAGPAPTPSRTKQSTRTTRSTVIAAASAIPVGQAKSFVDPKTQQPAWLVHAAASTFVAFSAVCTHAGCGVSFDPSTTQFVCPCHGGTYDAKTGQVIGGPPPSPLPKIRIQVHNGEVTTA
jgi:thiosulfate dehydrogenase [quinone] large subunit